MSPENMSEPGVPRFSLNGDRYDMDTFVGRLKHRYRLIDPRGLFYNPAQLTLDSSDYIEMTTPTPVGAFTHLTDHWGVGVGLKIGGSA